MIGTNDSPPVVEISTGEEDTADEKCDDESKYSTKSPSEEAKSSTKSPSEETAPESKLVGSKHDELAPSAHCTNSFDSIVGKGKDLDGLEESFLAVFNASGDMNQLYAEKFKIYIIGYVEKWEKIVSTR